VALSQRVIVIGWDGLRGDMVSPQLTPNLFALGARYPRSVDVFPSVTRPNTASLSTGSYPGRHGIYSNTLPGPRGDRAAIDTGDRDSLQRLRAVNGGRIVPVTTLAEALAAAGKKVVSLGTGTTGQCTLFDPEQTAKTIHLTFSWPESLMATVSERVGPPPARAIPAEAANTWLNRVLLEYVLPELEPDLVLMWLCEPDTSQHYRGLGSPEAVTAIAGNDKRLGDIVAAVDASGVPTSIIVTSDHGHSTITDAVSMSGLLADSGFTADIASGRIVRTDSAFTVEDQPGSAALTRRLAEWLVTQPWVGALFGWSPAAGTSVGAAPVSVLWNDRNQVDLAAAATLLFSPAWNALQNEHGIVGGAVMTQLEAVAEHERSQGPVANAPAAAIKRLVSSHGSLSPRDLNHTLVLGGAGIRPGTIDVPSGIVDIAPTVLALLGLPELPDIDGRVLAEALVGGPEPSSLGVRCEDLATTLSGAHLGRNWVGTTAYLDVQYTRAGAHRPA
jgi:phosphonoacetate hydrolase